MPRNKRKRRDEFLDEVITEGLVEGLHKTAGRNMNAPATLDDFAARAERNIAAFEEDRARKEALERRKKRAKRSRRRAKERGIPVRGVSTESESEGETSGASSSTSTALDEAVARSQKESAYRKLLATMAPASEQMKAALRRRRGQEQGVASDQDSDAESSSDDVDLNDLVEHVAMTVQKAGEAIVPAAAMETSDDGVAGMGSDEGDAELAVNPDDIEVQAADDESGSDDADDPATDAFHRHLDHSMSDAKAEALLVGRRSLRQCRHRQRFLPLGAVASTAEEAPLGEAERSVAALPLLKERLARKWVERTRSSSLTPRQGALYQLLSGYKDLLLVDGALNDDCTPSRVVQSAPKKLWKADDGSGSGSGSGDDDDEEEAGAAPQLPTSAASEVRDVYVLHALNHVLKTRDLIVKHHAQLRKHQHKARVAAALARGESPPPAEKKTRGRRRRGASPDDANLDLDLDLDTLRDQGLTRPKVLIVVPMRNRARAIIERLMALAPRLEVDQVTNLDRFKAEFADPPEEAVPPSFHRKPRSFQQTFHGNIDDCFRVGISFGGKSMRLFSSFYSSDIIVASPLGLRLVVGAEEEQSVEYDFMSSIEMLIIDGTDALEMQNWEHVETVVGQMNRPLLGERSTDWSRVRWWYLNAGWPRLYRQTIVLGAHASPAVNALFHKQCNYEGFTRVTPAFTQGTINQVVLQVRQVFARVPCAVDAPQEQHDQRFDYFVDELLPRLRDIHAHHRGGTAIYVPSYFDFVRLRNYFSDHGMSFTVASEYTDMPGITRARSQFFNRHVEFLIFTERFHYFHRLVIRGIQRLVFYGPPTHASFYPHLINHMTRGDDDDASGASQVWLLYTPFDQLAVKRILGAKTWKKLKSSSRVTHLFV